MKLPNSFWAGALVLLLAVFCGVQAFAADSPPTLADAHDFIGDLIARGAVYSDSGRKYPYSNYQGGGCQSFMQFGYDGAYKEIDWSAISSILGGENTNNVFIRGSVIRRTTWGDTFVDTSSSHVVPDTVTSLRLERAMRLLMETCHRKSKFD